MTRPAAEIAAPPASAFPDYPASWHYFAPAAAVRRGPVSREVFGRRVVAFRTAGAGRLAALDARCSHFGTDLGGGCVVRETLQCPYHHWRFAAEDGRCAHIPAGDAPPAFARQAVFPAEERHGQVFVFNGREPRFPLPFYDDVAPGELAGSAPAEIVLDCPWWMVGANAFDLQHFRAAHDRRLLGAPRVDQPAPGARRAAATFAVAGDDLRDRLTRWLAGPEVELSITDWGGNFLLATATFRRTKTRGLVVTEALGPGGAGVRVRLLAFVKKSRLGPWADRLHLAARRAGIRAFLQADAERLAGVRYRPGRLLPGADALLVGYFRWLAEVPGGGSIGGRVPPPRPGPPATR